MIKVKSGKIIYKLILEDITSNKDELEIFFDVKGYNNKHDIFTKKLGNLKHKFCPVSFKIGDGLITLLFTTEYDSDKFYDFIGNFFQHGN